MFPEISNSLVLVAGKGVCDHVPEVYRWNLDLYDNEIYDSIHD